MAFDWKLLSEITTIANAAAAVYTNPANTTTYVRAIMVRNTNTAAEDVKLYNVPDNAGAVGVAAAANELAVPKSPGFENLAMNDEWEWYAPAGHPGIILEDENDTIQAVTTTAAKVTIQLFGGTE